MAGCALQSVADKRWHAVYLWYTCIDKTYKSRITIRIHGSYIRITIRILVRDF